jgi:hypothetical protein
MRIMNTTRNGSGRLSIALQQIADLASGGAPLRIELGREIRHGTDPGIQPRDFVDRIERDHDGLWSKMADSLVDDDARQPCCKTRVRTEVREVFERAQIGLLHDILGLSIVPDDRTRDAVEPLIVTPNDQAQRGCTPLKREAHEFGIDHSGQRQLGGGLLRHVH